MRVPPNPARLKSVRTRGPRPRKLTPGLLHRVPARPCSWPVQRGDQNRRQVGDGAMASTRPAEATVSGALILASKRGDQLSGVAAAVQQLADVRPGATQRLERGD